MLAAPRSDYRTSAVEALVRKDVLDEPTLRKIEELSNDERPWVRLAAWESNLLIQERLKNQARAKKQLGMADRLLQHGKPNRARFVYGDALQTLRLSIWVDQEKAGYAEMQIARCHARRGATVLVARSLETAFEHDPALRETFEAELQQEGSDWALLRGTRWIERLLGES